MSGRARGLFVLFVMLVTAACGDDGYAATHEGDQDRFIIVGEIKEVGERSVTVHVEQIIQADRKAGDWIKHDHDHQIHDNYFHGDDQMTVGLVWRDGVIVELDKLEEGQTIKVVGRIRQSDNDTGDRPVFDSIYTQE